MSDKHNDDDRVMFGYASNLNISFHGKEESSYTWGDWREMSEKEQNDAIEQHIWELVDVWVEE